MRDFLEFLDFYLGVIWEVSEVAGVKLTYFADVWVPMWLPGGTQRALWNLALGVALSYIALVTPLQAAFEYEALAGAEFEHVDLALDVVFLVDIGINFRTSYVMDGMLVRDSKRVAAHYAGGMMVPDLLASFPYTWLLVGIPSPELDQRPLSARNARMLRLLRPALRLARSEFAINLPFIAKRFHSNPALLRVAHLVTLLICSCHWLGCIWWLTSVNERQQGRYTIWGPSNHTLSAPLDVQYGWAFFWGASLVTGFMPFDVYPVYAAEILLTIVAMMFGLVISVFIISSTTTAMQAIDSKQVLGAQKIDKIAGYLKFK